MTEKRRTTTEQARRVGDEIGVDWSRFDLEQFCAGMDVEFEHGSHDSQTDVTGGDAGRDFYVRQMRDWKASIDVERIKPAGLATYARWCGATLARRTRARGTGSRSRRISARATRSTKLSQPLPVRTPD